MFLKMMRAGFHYVFNEPARRNSDTASRATFMQFQEYPENNIQGAGQLVAPNNRMGNMWRVNQPPQLIEIHIPVPASLVGGGTAHSMIRNQPLADDLGAMG